MCEKSSCCASTLPDEKIAIVRFCLHQRSKARGTSLSVIFGQIYFPTYSNGLKEIAGWLGFRWSDRDSSGLQSILWRNEWEQAKAPSLKDELITYNSEDCVALELVADAVRQVRQNGIGSDSERASRLEVVDADKADSKTTMWGKFSSSIHGFEAINKAARWNYQRDRIYIRTDVQLKKAKRKKKNLLKRAVHISKVVVCQLPPFCPLCQKKGFRTSRMITKRLHDLRFSRSGVTGWIRKYQFQVFQCPACRSYTPWPKEFWDRTMYGRNLETHPESPPNGKDVSISLAASPRKTEGGCPRRMRCAFVRMWLPAACLNTSVRRTVGTTPLSIKSPGTVPRPTDGSWSTSPTTIEVSSTTRRPQVSVFDSFLQNRPVAGSISSRQWIVFAAKPVVSVSRFAARPVGAQASTSRPWHAV